MVAKINVYYFIAIYDTRWSSKNRARNINRGVCTYLSASNSKTYYEYLECY